MRSATTKCGVFTSFLQNLTKIWAFSPKTILWGISFPTGSCNTNAMLEVAGSTAVQMQHLHSSWWAVMSDINNTEGDVTKQGDASTGCIVRAHSSLRGSVDLW